MRCLQLEPLGPCVLDKGDYPSDDEINVDPRPDSPGRILVALFLLLFAYRHQIRRLVKITE